VASIKATLPGGMILASRVFDMIVDKYLRIGLASCNSFSNVDRGSRDGCLERMGVVSSSTGDGLESGVRMR
jgi:hypothetical protein